MLGPGPKYWILYTTVLYPRTKKNLLIVEETEIDERAERIIENDGILEQTAVTSAQTVQKKKNK